MSISNPTLSNPCTKFIEYSGETGIFSWYNKEEKQKEALDMPIYFVVLDELNTVTGFNKKHDCGIYSNEISILSKEILRVKTFKGGESVTGLYADIKDNIVAMGGKFTKSIYALLIHQDLSTEFVNFKLKGSGFSAWCDKGFKVDTLAVGIVDLVEEKNGNNTYLVPVFKPFKMTPEIREAAITQDKILQEYLKEYKAQYSEQDVAKAEAVREAEVPEKVEEPVANTGFVKESREERMTRAKAIIDAPKSSGKQFTPAMSKTEEIGFPSDAPDDLPF